MYFTYLCSGCTVFYSSQQVTELSRFKELPDEVPLPLVIGTKVTGLQFIFILNNNNNNNNNNSNNNNNNNNNN